MQLSSLYSHYVIEGTAESAYQRQRLDFESQLQQFPIANMQLQLL